MYKSYDLTSPKICVNIGTSESLLGPVILCYFQSGKKLKNVIIETVFTKVGLYRIGHMIALHHHNILEKIFTANRHVKCFTENVFQ